MRERDIEAYLVKRVKAMGGEVRKVKWIGRRGAPDRVVMLPTKLHDFHIQRGHFYSGPAGCLIWIELKAPGQVAKPHQLREHALMHQMGQHVEVVDSFARVDEVLA